jgi:hypothetical protein
MTRLGIVLTALVIAASVVAPAMSDVKEVRLAVKGAT